MADSSSQPSVGEFVAGIEWSKAERPEEFSIDGTRTETGGVSPLRAGPTHISKVVEKRDQPARSFRTFLDTISFNLRRHYPSKVIEPNDQ
jgi:hypothetical protein